MCTDSSVASCCRQKSGKNCAIETTLLSLISWAYFPPWPPRSHIRRRSAGVLLVGDLRVLRSRASGRAPPFDSSSSTPTRLASVRRDPSSATAAPLSATALPSACLHHVAADRRRRRSPPRSTSPACSWSSSATAALMSLRRGAARARRGLHHVATDRRPASTSPACSCSSSATADLELGAICTTSPPIAGAAELAAVLHQARRRSPASAVRSWSPRSSRRSRPVLPV